MKWFKQLKEDVSCVFDRDPAARNLAEVVLAYPGVHAVALHRVSHALWQREQHLAARVLSHVGRVATGIEIHPGATIGRRFFIDHGMGVVIGETAEVGDDCTLYQAVTLGGTSWDKGKRHPALGNNVVIGAGAKVLGPIRIGDGARVGSNAVVIKEVPDNNTAVGFPAYLIQEGQGEVVGGNNREAINRKMGFDAYGLMRKMPDPVSRTINGVLDHIYKMDERIEVLSERVGDCDEFENLDIAELALGEGARSKAKAKASAGARTSGSKKRKKSAPAVKASRDTSPSDNSGKSVRRKKSSAAAGSANSQNRSGSKSSS